MLCSQEQKKSFLEDGAVYLKGAFTDWVELLKQGVEENLKNPGPSFADNVSNGGGRFWDDYCNWQRIPAFQNFIEQSQAARFASELMESKTVQLFHDHVLVKEPGTSMPTPWHQDSPYYFVHGTQTVSFWIPLDAVSKESSLQFLAGSHRWEKEVLPTSWADNSDFYASNRDKFRPVPNADSKEYRDSLRVWEMKPGDAIAFHFRTVHGAKGNPGTSRRRAFSLRLVGDDARYVNREGRTSPPFPGHNMQDGQKLREDWFPYLT